MQFRKIQMDSHVLTPFGSPNITGRVIMGCVASLLTLRLALEQINALCNFGKLQYYSSARAATIRATSTSSDSSPPTEASLHTAVSPSRIASRESEMCSSTQSQHAPQAARLRVVQ